MKLGIASWSVPWSIGVQGYPRPEHAARHHGLLEKAVEANAAVLQIADNLPLHELPKSELDQLRDAAAALGLALEAGTRGLDPEHLARYIAIAGRIGARVLRTVLSGSLCGRNRWPRPRPDPAGPACARGGGRHPRSRE